MSNDSAGKKPLQPFVIPSEAAGLRLDRLLAETYPAAGFSLVQKLCRKGQVRLDGKRVKGNERVQPGQQVRVPPALAFAVQNESKDQPEATLPQMTKAARAALAVAIIYEDDALVVLNKPYNVAVQGGSGQSRSLDKDMLAYYATSEAGKKAVTPRLVHRLDKTTTGCLVLAKTRDAARALTHSFRTRGVEKTYWAICAGKPSVRQGTIKAPLAKSGPVGAQKVRVDDAGDKAMTDFAILDTAGDYHIVMAKPRTGRMHQVRVHLAEAGLPIVGDGKYGGQRLEACDEDIPAGKLFLHARAVAFDHPATGRHFQVKAPLPDHFTKVFSLFGWQENEMEEAQDVCDSGCI